MNILIAEDDFNIRQGLVEVLSNEGYQVRAAENGQKALELYHEQQPDFIILDIMMPILDGYKACQAIRKINATIPIIFLSAKGEEIDKVIGLELGADDYLNKPFGIQELKARIRAITRRCLANISHDSEQILAPFDFGEIQILPKELRANYQNQYIELSLKEIKILQCLYINKGKIVTRDQLFDYVWGLDYIPNSRTLDQHISRLRKQIEALNPLIKTIHGQGYRYE